MSLFSEKVEVCSADGSRFEAVDLLVDTGSSYTWLPRTLVERLVLKVIDRQPVRLADGRIVEKDAVEVKLRVNGKVRTNLCLVADKGDMSLLGVLTLETFSLGVDPHNKKLVPVVALAAQASKQDAP